MQNYLRRIKRKLFGAPPTPRPAYGRMAVRNRFADMRARIDSASPVIVDGGAHEGAMTADLLTLFPGAQIHAIKPRQEATSVLQNRFSGNSQMTIHACALGARDGTIHFNVLNRSTSSSVLTPTAINHHYHPGEMRLAKTVEVPLARLDTLIHGDIDLLKLDLQGYELEALKGSTGILPRTKIITTEVEFVPLYEGQPLFAEIDIFLREQGFYLLNLYELWTHPDGQLTAGDAVYLNTRYFDEASNP